MKKKYWIIIVLIFLVWLDWYIRAPDATSRQLTSAIEIFEVSSSFAMEEIKHTTALPLSYIGTSD